MSAASSASVQVRRTPAHVQQPARQPVRSASVPAFAAADQDNEFTLNLGDIPRVQETMDVDGLKPSLLSRLFDLVAPISRR